MRILFQNVLDWLKVMIPYDKVLSYKSTPTQMAFLIQKYKIANERFWICRTQPFSHSCHIKIKWSRFVINGNKRKIYFERAD